MIGTNITNHSLVRKKHPAHLAAKDFLSHVFALKMDNYFVLKVTPKKNLQAVIIN